MPERAMEETAAAVKHPVPSPARVAHAHVHAPPPVWDTDSARVPGAPSAVLAIQRAAGNQAVMRMLDAQRPGHPLAGPASAVQRSSEDELDDEQDVQRASAALHEPSDEAIRSAAAEGIRTPSATLPHLDRIQASFGRHSIAHVQAHVGPEAARASRAMNALAYASGNHVVFGATPDLRTSAHEAAHIIQQQAGVQLSGGIGRADDSYERHADAVADAVVAGRWAEGLLDAVAPASENRSYRAQSSPLMHRDRQRKDTGAAIQRVKHKEASQIYSQMIQGVKQQQSAPTVQRYIMIGETRYERMLGLLDQFLEKTVIPDLGQESQYYEDRETVLAQFNTWTSLNQHFENWSDIIDKINNILGEKTSRSQPEAASAVHTALVGEGVRYAIQGSYAARLHGAPIGAGDIDVLVDNMMKAKVAFQKKDSGLKEKEGSLVVGKWKHANGADIDLAMGLEFGINIAHSEAIGGVNVLNIYEVLSSLALRPVWRDKEVVALFWLVKHKGDVLTEEQKKQIAERLPEWISVKTWEDLIKLAGQQF